MPYGYLGTVVIFGVLTLAALIAPRRPRRFAIAAYMLSVVVNEVPLLMLVLFVLATVPAVLADGLLTTAPGVAVFVVAVTTGAGLLTLQRPIPLARGALESALGEGLATPSPWRSRFLPFSWRHGVRRVGRLSYGPARRNRLDVYRRRGLHGPAPVLVYFHGGGYFSGGRRRESWLLRHRLARRGWVVISAGYRLRPRADWPDHLVDAKRVLAWVREHAVEHGMDARTVAVAGSSAGGHLSVLCALTAGDPALQPGFENADTRVSAAVGLYGYHGRYYGRGPDEDPVSDPCVIPAGGAPPILLVHGTKDTYVPVQTARRLTAHLRESSPSPVIYAELPGAQHGFDLLASERFEAVVAATARFLEREVIEAARSTDEPARP